MIPSRPELSHAVLAVRAFALRQLSAHRDDRIDGPTPHTLVLDSNRPDLYLVAIELEDDAIVVVSLGVDDFAEIESHAA